MSYPIHLVVRRTKGDCFWGVLFSTVRNPRVWMSYLVGAVLVASLSFALSADQSLLGRLQSAAFTFVLMMAMYLVILFVCVIFAVRRNWSLPGAFAEMTFDLSDDGVAVVHETGRGETKWIVWKSAFETKQLILIRHQAGLVQIIPKRNLSPEIIASIRTLLARRLGAERVHMGAPA